MVFIYDFDGTLTPYSLPQYPVLKYCGYDDELLTARAKKYIDDDTGFCEAYYKCCRDILSEHGIDMSRDNICLGAQATKFNNGVLDYFKKFQSSKTGIKHYIVTSGIKDYVDETAISELVDGIYGVTFHQTNGIFQDIDVLLSEEKKVDVIKEIQAQNNGTNEIVYFGDGLTDRFAFEYVHSIGGRNVFVALNESADANYQKINVNGIIDRCFNPDFGEGSKIDNFAQSVVKEKNSHDSNDEELRR